MMSAFRRFREFAWDLVVGIYMTVFVGTFVELRRYAIILRLWRDEAAPDSAPAAGVREGLRSTAAGLGRLAVAAGLGLGVGPAWPKLVLLAVLALGGTAGWLVYNDTDRQVARNEHALAVDRMLRDGRLEEAAERLRALAAASPEEPEFASRLAALESGVGDPDDELILTALLKRHFEAGRTAEAAREARKLAARRPEDRFPRCVIVAEAAQRTPPPGADPAAVAEFIQNRRSEFLSELAALPRARPLSVEAPPPTAAVLSAAAAARRFGAGERAAELVEEIFRSLPADAAVSASAPPSASDKPAPGKAAGGLTADEVIDLADLLLSAMADREYASGLTDLWLAMQRLLARTAESSHRLPPDRLWRLGLVMELHLALAPWEMEQRNRLAPADLKRAVEEGARRQAEVWANLRRAVPGNAEGWVGAATAALRRGDRPEAVRLLDAGLAAALPLGPHRPDRRWLAELRDRIAAPPVRSGTADPDAAADRPASEAEREATAEALRPVAESAAAAGRADRALEIARHVRRGVAERPPFWAASLEASRCLASGRSDGPEEAAAAMAPLKDEFLRTPDGVAMWAAALSGSGRADEIDPEAARAVTGSLSNVAAMVRGLILSDRAAAAASLADAVVRRRAGQKEARLLLAEALCESADDGDGNWDDRTVWRALDQCELLLKRSPADPRLLGRVVWLYCEGLGSAEEALRRGEPLLKAWKSSRAGGDPGRSGDPTGGTASGAATGDPGRTGDATGDGASGPLPVRALHALGVALLRKGRLPEAGDALRDALALASRSPDSLDAAEAPSLRLHLAEALLASGRPGDARLEWQSARSSAKLRRDRSAAERLAARFAEGK